MKKAQFLTVKEIADKIGISKQRVYRYIKKECINEAHQKNGVMYYDDTAQTLIKGHFSDKECITDTHQNCIGDTVNDTLIEMLKEELNIKNKQIDELNLRLAESNAALVSAQQTAQAEQALHAGTLQKQLNGGKDDFTDKKVSPQKKSIFAKMFKKKQD